MLSLLGLYSQKDLPTAEKNYQSQIKKHSELTTKDAHDAIGLGPNKHFIGRVTEIAKGMPVFTNYSHMFWNEEAEMNNYVTKIKEGGMLPGIDFMDNVRWDALCIVEEKLIYENTATASEREKAIRFNVYSPDGDSSPEDIYNFHIDVHAPHIMDTVAKVATPGLKKYVIGWISEVVTGKALFKNYVKMWWDDEGAMNRYLQELKSIKLPDGTPQSGPQGELGKQVTWNMISFVKERLITDR